MKRPRNCSCGVVANDEIDSILRSTHSRKMNNKHYSRNLGGGVYCRKYHLNPSITCRTYFAELLANELAGKQLHQMWGLAVDVYHLQHPQSSTSQLTLANCIHLASLYSYLVDDVPTSRLFDIRRKMMAHSKYFIWLNPPKIKSRITVVDLLDTKTTQDYVALFYDWAECIFSQWLCHHKTIKQWLKLIDESELSCEVMDFDKMFSVSGKIFR